MNENQAVDKFREGIEVKFGEGYENYLDEQGIPEKLVPKNVLNNVIDEQVDLGFNEFWETEKDSIDENNLFEKITEYISENYDSDYVFVKFQEKINEEQIKIDLLDGLVLILSSSEPYSVLSRNYWMQKARMVGSLKELSGYANGDDLEDFIMKYASDWEEIAKENKE